MAAVKSIEPWQHRKIRAIAGALGMNKDDLHSFAEVGSMTELGFTEANNVIDRLEKLQGHSAPPRRERQQKAPPAEDRPGMATASQQRMVLFQMYELQKYSPSDAEFGVRLRGIIKKALGLDVAPRQEFRWMSFDDCHKLIETMKRYVASAKKKAGGSG